jgi:hypothetical protein
VSALLPGPNLEIETALGIGLSGSAGAWDEGAWDANVWANPDTELGDWVDITCYTLDGLSLGAGSQSADGVVTRWEAATCALDVYGAAFDPRSGPWAGLLGPSIPVRVRWRVPGAVDWVTAFLGYTDDDGFSYDPKTKQAHLSATDATRIFNAFDGVEQNSQGGGETAAQRVTRIADMVGWDTEARDITAGGVAVQATTLAQNAWTMLLQIADTDLALLWINRAGQLAYRPQGKVSPSRRLNVVIGCDPSSVPDDATLIKAVQMAGQQPTVTRNIVSISRQQIEGDTDDTPVTVTVRDDASIERYLPHTYQRTDLIHLADEWSRRIANAILQSSAWPASSPESTELDTRLDVGAGPLLLGLEPSLSVIVDDGFRPWICGPAGWTVEIWRARITGTIDWLDVSAWFGAAWDSAIWDQDRWAF